jgi:pimeloyl-ACP methyl ester carboxylesterase
MTSILRPVAGLVVLLTGAGAVPALASERLEPCADERLGPGAECGVFTVAEGRGSGGDRTIELWTVVLRATGPTSAEPVFFLAGGPGQGATDLAELALGPFATVREVRDIVLVDQRGTGRSNRLDCPNAAASDPRSVFGHLFEPRAIAACLQEVSRHADPRLYITELAVADLDEVRARLGYDRVLLWGGSGGTRTALVWMRLFPDRVAGALLDGVTPTDFRAPSTYARGCQDALDRVIEDCRQQEECRRIYPNLEAEFERLLGLFDDGPIKTSIRTPAGEQVQIEMHRGDLGYALRSRLYSSRSIAQLPAWIHRAAATGDLQDFAQAYWEREVHLRPVVAMGVHLSIFCSEDLPFVRDEEIARLTEGSFLGTYLFEQYRAACAEWSAAQVDRSFLEPVRSDIPVLLFSGYYDPSTPAWLADRVATWLPQSRHVVVRNESHGAEFGCGRQLAIDFMRTGSLEGLPPACEAVGPVRFETAAGSG